MIEYVEQLDGSFKRVEVPSANLPEGTVVGPSSPSELSDASGPWSRPMVATSKKVVWGSGIVRVDPSYSTATVTNESYYNGKTAGVIFFSGLLDAAPNHDAAGSFFDLIYPGMYTSGYAGNDDCFMGSLLLDPSIECPTLYSGLYPIVQSSGAAAGTTNICYLLYATSRFSDSSQIFSTSNSYQVVYYTMHGGFVSDIHIGSNLLRLYPGGTDDGVPDLFFNNGSLSSGSEGEGQSAVPLGAAINAVVEFTGSGTAISTHLPRRLGFMLMGA